MSKTFEGAFWMIACVIGAVALQPQHPLMALMLAFLSGAAFMEATKHS
jgi:ABC-type uncharacterized transport system permease subunit